MDDAARAGAHHHNRFEEEAPQLLGIGNEPEFGIAQRALGAVARRKFVVGLHFIVRGTTRSQKSGRAEVFGNRDLASALYSSMVEWAEHFDAEIYYTQRSPVGHGESPRIQF